MFQQGKVISTRYNITSRVDQNYRQLILARPDILTAIDKYRQAFLLFPTYEYMEAWRQAYMNLRAAHILNTLAYNMD